MPRRVVEDMIMKGGRKKGLQKPVKEASPFLRTLQKDLQKESHVRTSLPPQESSFSDTPPFQPKKDSFSKKWYAFIAILIVVGGSFIYFSSRPLVMVTITPQNEVKDIDLLITAGKETTSADILYTLLEESEDVSFSIPSTGSKDIDRRAQGQIVLFNSFNKSPQLLAARTRFTDPSGKIFRISSSVKIPGYTVKAGKVVPGSIEVTIYADETGDEYNIGYADFTLPGLAGNPAQFAKIVARSKTEITGGFSGKIKLYDEALLLKERQDKEKILAESLTKKVQAKIPLESTLFSKAVAFSYVYEVNDRVGENKADEGTVAVTIKGSAKGMLLKTSELNALLAKSMYPNEKEALEVDNLSVIAFSFSDEGVLSQKVLGDIDFSLRGKPRFVWVIPDETLKKALAGTPKDTTSYKEIFKTRFPSIVSAKVESFRPFWMRHFPNDPSKIIIKKTLPETKTP
jgi:hypothetical protein